MKQLALIFLFTILSFSAFAQFPLGSKATEIKSYFAQNIPYATIQDFKTKEGVNALCFTKVKVVGDYTFYFDNNGNCSSYVVTYDNNELTDLQTRFDVKFCRMQETKWEDAHGAFDVTLIPSKEGENYFSIIYKPTNTGTVLSGSFAAN